MHNVYITKVMEIMFITDLQVMLQLTSVSGDIEFNSDSDVAPELIIEEQARLSSDRCSPLESVISSDSHASSNSSEGANDGYSSCGDELMPEQVRWMYRDSMRHKKWIPFIGYDSLRLECKHRETRASFANARNLSSDFADELVVVKGGLYEVDVIQMKCFPIYWSSKG
jgi:hypothetical protein